MNWTNGSGRGNIRSESGEGGAEGIELGFGTAGGGIVSEREGGTIYDKGVIAEFVARDLRQLSGHVTFSV